ncbi:WXG100 family type VII secretion target [Nocardia sp. NPDC058705]|uniref:WXG100 family type VII secretion target n=1 Tax=Nocardia sp. NPDC058705 TaxID=3346609 RepID=UPI003696B2D5
MSGRVFNDGAAASAAQGDMANAVEGMQFTLKAITDEVVAAKGWQGAARGAFNQAADAWSVEAGKLQTLLDQIANHVGEGTKEYIRQDGEGEDAFRFTSL